jgi:two-component system chemotaxis sensor kinase CheA
LAPLLTASGYDVVTAADADAALRLCEAGRDFDVIVSDIEMPGMDGFSLAEHLTQRTRWKDIPLVALSALSTPLHGERGRAAGFVDHVAKRDRDSLLRTLSHVLSSRRTA